MNALFLFIFSFAAFMLAGMFPGSLSAVNLFLGFFAGPETSAAEPFGKTFPSRDFVYIVTIILLLGLSALSLFLIKKGPRNKRK